MQVSGVERQCVSVSKVSLLLTLALKPLHITAATHRNVEIQASPLSEVEA